MPEEIVQCVKYYPNPREAKEEFLPLVSTVHVADRLTKKIFIGYVGYGGDEKTPEIENGVLEELGLKETDIEEA